MSMTYGLLYLMEENGVDIYLLRIPRVTMFTKESVLAELHVCQMIALFYRRNVS